VISRVQRAQCEAAAQAHGPFIFAHASPMTSTMALFVCSHLTQRDEMADPAMYGGALVGEDSILPSKQRRNSPASSTTSHSQAG